MAEFSPLMHPLILRWADIDANYHLRHTAYYDLAASARIDLLNSFGLTMNLMQKEHIGPVLFREEGVFRREIRYHDELYISTRIQKLKHDFSRFQGVHEFLRKDPDQTITVCALVTVDIAWIDTIRRKLTTPPGSVIQAFEQFPRTNDFAWWD
jgi:acyl-CoA thioester hydrolase